LYGVWSQISKISQWIWVSTGVCHVVGLSPTSLPELYFEYFFLFLKMFIILRYGTIFYHFHIDIFIFVINFIFLVYLLL